ncbi:MAG: TonB-dependent receptor [Betaproteobacteria bacterium]|nr:TonB-dependent receptor [Betaproteobacteria bacterium]
MSSAFRATVLAVACSSLHSSPSPAQNPDVIAATTSPKKLEEIVITGNPLKDKDTMVPVSVMKDEELLVKRGTTLGETLNSVAGVASTFFGPNAARPIVRGLDGDRIRVLSNSSASFDASTVSFDHNPSIDPLAIERIEVLRGPAALLYGGSAIGGVVNVIDSRIAREPMSGFGGAIEMRFGGAEREKGASALLDAGNGSIALHADAFSRSTGDYAVPTDAGVGSKVVNSASESRGGALGGTLHVADGYVGLVQTDTRNRYGTVAEAEVTIDMKHRRTGLEAEWRTRGFLEAATLKAGRTRYEHTEFEGSEVGTVFNSAARDLRLELKHGALGPFKGVIGIQAESFGFSALGEEAFLPKSETRNRALFIYEEFTRGIWRFNTGARLEKSDVDSAGAGASGVGRFGAPGRRSFNGVSASFGSQWKFSPTMTWNASIATSQRAPACYELFADGPHVATAAYEVGDRNLQRERATALDLGFTRKIAEDGKSALKFNLFSNRFANFIALRRSGVDRDAGGHAGVTDCGDGTSVESSCVAEILPEFAYQGVKARLTGFEAELDWRILGGKDRFTLDLELKTDITRAQDLTHGEPLPRIAPLRVRGAAVWSSGPWMARLEIDHAARQDRFPSDDALGATPSHTMLHAALSYKWASGGNAALFFLKANNLGDRVAFNASSIDTIRGLAPLPGRALKAGVQVSF